MHRPVIEVHMNECKVTGDKILHTDGASTCIVLAAVNTETNRGLLGHLSHDDVEDARFLDEVVEAISNLGPSIETQIRLGGGGIYFYDSEYPESAEYNQAVERRIGEMALQNDIPDSNIKISWLWGNDEACATVDCLEGTIELEESFNNFLDI